MYSGSSICIILYAERERESEGQPSCWSWAKMDGQLAQDPYMYGKLEKPLENQKISKK